MKRLLIVLPVLLILFSACTGDVSDVLDEETIPKGYTLIVRKYDSTEGFLSIYSDGYNVLDSYGNKRNDYSKDAKPALKLSLTAKPSNEFQTFDGTDILNPATVSGMEVSPYIPYNYKSNLNSSAIYIATCKANGYTLVSLKQDSVSADIELVKNDTKLRVIIYESILKIYAKGLENMPWR